MKNYKAITGAIIAIIIVILLVFALGNSTNKDSDRPFKVGALLCLTGPCAEWGENSLDGLHLAVEEINRNGGILGRQIEVVVEDTAEEDPSNAVSAYNGLRFKNVDYIVGSTWSNAGLSIAPIASNDEVIITSPSLGVAEFNETAENIFNVWPHDSEATKVLAQFAIQQGWRKVAIFGSKETWYQIQGDTFEDEFTRLGGTVVLKEEPFLKQRDLRTEATKIKSSNPEVVMYSNFDNMGIMAKELRNLGYSGPQISILMDESRVEQGQGALEGTIFVEYEKPKQFFIDAYKKKFSKEPGITADTAYDAMYVYKKAIEEAGSFDLNKVSEILNNLKEYSGASGKLVFDGKGGVLKDPVFSVVRNGKFERYEQ